MAKDIQREWLQVNRICKEVKWLSYDPDYSGIDFKTALRILEQLKEKIGKEIKK